MDLFITIHFQSIDKIWKYRPDGVQDNCEKNCLDQLMQPIKSAIWENVCWNWICNQNVGKRQRNALFTFSTFFVLPQALIDCLWTNRNAFPWCSDANTPPNQRYVCWSRIFPDLDHRFSSIGVAHLCLWTSGNSQWKFEIETDASFWVNLLQLTHSLVQKNEMTLENLWIFWYNLSRRGRLPAQIKTKSINRPGNKCRKTM